MASEKDDKEKAPVINTHIDPAIRAAMDAFMADYNAKNDGKHSIRSCVEASMKGWLKSHGFWPWPPEQPAETKKPGRKKEKAGAA